MILLLLLLEIDPVMEIENNKIFLNVVTGNKDWTIPSMAQLV